MKSTRKGQRGSHETMCEGIGVLGILSIMDSIWRKDNWENRRLRETYMASPLIKFRKIT